MYSKNIKAGKVIHTEEAERKFLVNHIQKTGNWDREFRIVQWYPESESIDGEKKYKLIFDLLNNTVRYISVTKFRKNDLKSDKTVSYFKEDDFNIGSFLSVPFVAKSRSIIADIHLDYFTYGKLAGSFLLEIEQEIPGMNVFSELNIQLGDEVTHNKKYRNKNMCEPFGKHHANDLLLILKDFRFLSK